MKKQLVRSTTGRFAIIYDGIYVAFLEPDGNPEPDSTPLTSFESGTFTQCSLSDLPIDMEDGAEWNLLID